MIQDHLNDTMISKIIVLLFLINVLFKTLINFTKDNMIKMIPYKIPVYLILPKFKFIILDYNKYEYIFSNCVLIQHKFT